MKMFKTTPVFILLLTEIRCRYRKTRASIKGYLCNAEGNVTTPTSPPYSKVLEISSPKLETPQSRDVPGAPERKLPSLVVAGVSIALVLLCILIVAIFWYAWKKSQEGSIELNPIPYGEAGVSLRNLSVPENQQEWPFERAVQ